MSEEGVPSIKGARYATVIMELIVLRPPDKLPYFISLHLRTRYLAAQLDVQIKQ